jgi:hypothetical protein
MKSAPQYLSTPEEQSIDFLSTQPGRLKLENLTSTNAEFSYSKPDS